MQQFKTNSALVEVQDLVISVKESGLKLINQINFNLQSGIVTGLVGESGSGKSLTALALMQLLSPALQASGDILFYNENKTLNINSLNPRALMNFRGNQAGMIFQDPMSSLNPSLTVGAQVMEAYLLHNKTTSKAAKNHVLEMFQRVLIPAPRRIFYSYPFQLSGGQRQRVMIAMALINNPSLLIADEATTALDVTVQHEIITLIKNLQRDLNLTVLFITHDLGLLNNFADHVMVMQNGNIVEQGSYHNVMELPVHPYTKGLIACRPNPAQRAYQLPVIEDFEVGKSKEMKKRVWPTVTDESLIDARDIDVDYAYRGKENVRALKQVSFNLYQGETLGLVGESGCGKTSLSKAILKLVPYKGQIYYNGKPLTWRTRKNELRFRQSVQFVFQDPYASLNPVMKIGDSIREILKVHGKGKNRKSRNEQVDELLQQVDLTDSFAQRYPHELSGGQRQRVAIAKALAPGPEILILDEAVAALDVSVQAKILNLLNNLKLQHGLTYIFISHDLEVVHYMANRIIVMKDGVIEESGDAVQLFNHARSEYTRKLLNSIPGLQLR